MFCGSVVFCSDDSLPNDFVFYAEQQGITTDALVDNVYNSMPLVSRDDSKTKLKNALVGWTTYKMFI